MNVPYIRSLLERGVLTRRDEDVLLTVDELGALSVGQLTRLYWQSLSTARHRLRKLYDLHLLDRSEYNPARMIRLGLQPGVVYTLGKAGRLWLNMRTGKKERYVLHPLNTLYHNLALAEFIVILTEAVRHAEDWQMNWQGERSCRIVTTRGDRRRVLLEPDGLIIFNRPGDDSHRYFYLERDLGTENYAAFQRKIRRYGAFFLGKQWRTRYGWSRFPPVLVVTNNAGRARGLIDVIQQAKSPISWGVSDIETLISLGRADLLRANVWTVLSPGKPPRQLSLLSDP